MAEDSRKLASAGRSPLMDSLMYDSHDENVSILQNWDMHAAHEYVQARREYNEAIKEILNRHGGFPDVQLGSIPNYRTSKQAILKKIPKKHEL